MIRRVGLLLTLAVAPLPARHAGAQTPPACPELVVSSSTLSYPLGPQVAADLNGNFVVVWKSNAYPQASLPVSARRYDAAGSPRGPAFEVSASSTSYVSHSHDVAGAADGRFVVAWARPEFDAFSPTDIVIRRYDANGVPLTGEVLANTYTTGRQSDVSVAKTADGRFVVVWSGEGTGGATEQSPGVFAQRFDAAGARDGGEFRVDSYTTGAHRGADVALAADGSFVVVWTNEGQDGDSEGIFGQRFDAQGAPQGPEFRVNTSTVGNQFRAQVAAAAAGNFVVVWQDQNAGERRVFGQRYDAAGAPQGGEFPLDSPPSVTAGGPNVTFDGAGGFLAIWTDGNANADVMARRFGLTGTPEGPPFVVNAETTGGQFGNGIARQRNRGFVATWSEAGLGPSEVKANVDCARFYPVTPCRLVDTRFAQAPALGANTERAFPIAGVCNIPADARAVAVSITAVAPTDSGFFRLWPFGQGVPLASAVNFVPGRTRAGNGIVPIGAAGQIAARCDMPAGSTGAAHLVLDVTGYFKR